MRIPFHLEINSQISVESLGIILEETSEPTCPLMCFKAGSKTLNAWQVFIQPFYLGIIHYSPLPIAMKVAQYFMLHYHPVKGNFGTED